jgi:hypothetical protein
MILTGMTTIIIPTFSHLSGTRMRMIAFSCTCQPNKKEENAHSTTDLTNPSKSFG